MSSAKKILAYNLKKLRLARGMTQENLAELTNLNFRTIGRIENEKCFCKAETLTYTGKSSLQFHIDFFDVFVTDYYKSTDKNSQILIKNSPLHPHKELLM